MYRQRSPILLQIIAALVLSVGLTVLLRSVGPGAMTITLFVLLALFISIAISIARAMLLARRPPRHPFGNGGGDWSGEREPRSPYPPHWPPRAEAATPEDEHQSPSRPVGYDYPQSSQPSHT